MNPNKALFEVVTFRASRRRLTKDRELEWRKVYSRIIPFVASKRNLIGA